MIKKKEIIHNEFKRRMESKGEYERREEREKRTIKEMRRKEMKTEEWRGKAKVKRREERAGGKRMKNTQEMIEIEFLLPPIQRCK